MSIWGFKGFVERGSPFTGFFKYKGEYFRGEVYYIGETLLRARARAKKFFGGYKHNTNWGYKEGIYRELEKVGPI